ncbi:nuclear transport factor 2 family protein [Streptomyces sp. H39-S7]|uniref:nuclear transport factor 2 family protein n=1 Tax=Streptomyces sp. H39-S7 TaxID=3004357 RepID=UPI0022AF8D35|nr:nuclear transport factor 2 family protein [Streptomyces sp. H39-S7]MCZ4125224.1 nuclear transport factor 2 family protein [Streptomyces sp. H39-S7]
MSEQNVDVVKTFFHLFSAGRLDEIRKEYLTDDFEWIYHGPASLPWAGVYRGAAGFDRFFEIVHGLLEVRDLEVQEYLDAGDRIVVLGVSHTRILANDATYDAPWMTVFRIRDGRICQYLDLYDTASVVEALNRPQP